jgi:hypothetical protein
MRILEVGRQYSGQREAAEETSDFFAAFCCNF